MPDNPSKLQNVQLTGEPSDGFRTGVVKPDGSAGGAIPDGGIPSAAKENVERPWCDCKDSDVFCTIKGRKMAVCWEAPWYMVPQNFRCKARERHLP